MTTTVLLLPPSNPPYPHSQHNPARCQVGSSEPTWQSSTAVRVPPPDPGSRGPPSGFSNWATSQITQGSEPRTLGNRQQLMAADGLNCAKTPAGLCAHNQTCRSQCTGMVGEWPDISPLKC